MTTTTAPENGGDFYQVAGWVAPEVTVGSIFYSSWGYDQTNVDFYRVVRRTKATVWVQKVTTVATDPDGGPTDHVVAGTTPATGYWVQKDGVQVYDHDAPAPIRKHRLVTYGSEPMFTLNSYSNAHLWDGRRTGLGWGH